MHSLARRPLMMVTLAAALMASPAAAFPPLANGIYGIYGDETDVRRLRAPAPNEVLVTYDQKIVDLAATEPVRFLLLHRSPDVPMSLAGKPEKKPGPRGNPMLHLTLDPKHASLLESFTRANAGKVNVAIVVGGQVLTTHKIREPIVGGRLQITRCSDDACETLFTELTAPPPASASLRDFEWLAGSWSGTEHGMQLEETWQPAAGGAMLGTCRAVTTSTLAFCEILTLREAAGGVEMRIRHFDGDLKAWEEKDKPMIFDLVSSRSGLATFQSRATEPAERLSYWRLGQRGLRIRLEKTRDGKPWSTTFNLRRAAAAK